VKFAQTAEEELDVAAGRRSEEAGFAPSLLAVATDALDDGLIVCDAKGRICWINASAKKLCGINWKSCLNKTIANLVDESSFPVDGIAEAFANKSSLSYIEDSHTGADFIIDIDKILDPRTSGLFFVICFKNVDLFVSSIKNGGPSKNSSSSLAKISDYNKNIQRIVLDEELEHLINLGIKAWTFGSRILISGESGVGKSQYARLLHERIKPASKSFVHVNCASIPESLFESEFFGYERGSFTGAHTRGKMGLVEIAEQGTLFLDEVGDIPITCQSKILRFLDDGTYLKVGATQPRTANVNIISASNRDLTRMVKEETFRADLHFRLKTVEVRIPPLRERRPLVKALIQEYLEYVRREHRCRVRLSQRCEDFLLNYDYPGNIRELENTLQHMTVVCDDTMDLDHLPEPAREVATQQALLAGKTIASKADAPPHPFNDMTTKHSSLRALVTQYERKLVSEMIRLHGSKRKAAKALDVDIATIVRKSR
jgi:transcriptional regulator with PAS, ATPase and Fis domain